MYIGLFTLTCLSSVFAFTSPWISPDWSNNEPVFSPGSLFWMTEQYKECPIIYRSIIDIEEKNINMSGFRIAFTDFAYIFLNGRQVAGHSKSKDDPEIKYFDFDLTSSFKQGKNVLVISTGPDGFALEGIIKFNDGKTKRVTSEEVNMWKVQKLPPLTMLELEPFMIPDFDDSKWFSIKKTDQKSLNLTSDELDKICSKLFSESIEKLDKDAEWRLSMLKEKGFAIIDWEAHGWAGAERLPAWVLDATQKALDDKSHSKHEAAEALTRFVFLSDFATNLQNNIKGLKILNASTDEIEALVKVNSSLIKVLTDMERHIKDMNYTQAKNLALEFETESQKLMPKRIINNLCRCLDNKFGWFDNNTLLDNNITNWGLYFDSPVTNFASPLSPAGLVSSKTNEVVIKGWNNLKPIKVYNKPQRLGPICLWAVLNSKIKVMKPSDEGVVYDRSRDGKLSENWMLLVHDLSAGGGLPIQIVFLHSPTKVIFKSLENDTNEVRIIFEKENSQFFILRPLKEWRGMLYQAGVLKSDPIDEANAKPYIDQCRLWSKALLNYPVTFSESFAKEGDFIKCVDIYNYWELKDEWGTKPVKIAPLPPLASYGLMMEYPGLEIISEAKVIGSLNVWGDLIAAMDQDYIIYKIPIEPIKRFGGFTSFCFGGSDIGEPGSITEIETIKHTGSNSFRPQHNQTGERAMRTLQWCWERGIQNVFNTDEKWVPDVCEHFRILAEKCKDYPEDAVAYDLLNEPETREPEPYNALMRKITAEIRKVDEKHLIYIEAFPPWGPGAEPFPKAAFENLKPTGDKLTCYSFHDYEYRLPERWPNKEQDIRDILNRWIPAFKFSIDNRCPIHLGEFGGFEQTDQSVFDNPCALTMMMDYLNIFDQFGWHWHYYSNRGTVQVRKDGSLQDSYVQEAHRRYFARGTFNINKR
ncbi:MAG: cellulase family glycosylhydrolase [bacterium]